MFTPPSTPSMLLARRLALLGGPPGRALALADAPAPSLSVFCRGLAKKRGRKGGGGGGKASGVKPSSPGTKPASVADATNRRAEGKAGQFVARLEHVRKVLPGGRVLFQDVSLQLLAGAKVGVLGPNGAGKSSLLKLLAGVETDHDGSTWRPNGLRIGMLEQEPTLDEGRSVMENVMDGVAEARDALRSCGYSPIIKNADGVGEAREALRRFEEINQLLEAGAEAGEKTGGAVGGKSGGSIGAKAGTAAGSSMPGASAGDDRIMDLLSLSLEDLFSEQAAASEKIESLDAWTLDAKVKAAMAALNCPPADAMPPTLSGGQRRRVALCRLLLSEPELLLLDEPTNHLDTNSVQWLEEWLARFRGTVVAVTHDRYFLDNVAGYILEVDAGAARPFKGNYSGWLKHKAEQLRLEQNKDEARASRLNSELQWIRTNPKGGRSQSRSRLRSYEELLDEQRGARSAERVQSGAISIVPGPRLGNQVLSVRRLSKSFGARLLFQNLSFELPPGAVLGVVGANGMGKSTLVKMIVGAEEPDMGEVHLGGTVVLGYVDQSRSGLDASKTVYEEISQGLDVLTLGDREVAMRAYVATFNLRGTTQEKRVGSLSGGERGRVHLAKTLRMGCNLLLLDEPTNDLDVDTLRSLEEALGSFAGSAVVVSHDRWFLDRVCDHTLAFNSDGSADFFEGSISDFDQWKAKRNERSVARQEGEAATAAAAAAAAAADDAGSAPSFEDVAEGSEAGAEAEGGMEAGIEARAGG